jgi:hypothetical protein
MNPTTCLDILEVIYDNVILLENNELTEKLKKFKSDDVQWVLNALTPTFEDMRDCLEMEEMNTMTFD